MIPDEAVEAAAKGIWEARPMERVYEEGSPNYGAAKPWDDIKQYQRDRCMTLARAALEAAAPHLMAAAWDEGYLACVDDIFRDQELGKTGQRLEDGQQNPYRKPTDA